MKQINRTLIKMKTSALKASSRQLAAIAALAGISFFGTVAASAQTPTPTGGAGTRAVGVLLCQYPDKPNTYGLTAANLLATTWLPNIVQINGANVDNSISGLIQDASLGTISFQGTQAFGWFTLPQPLTYYLQYPYGQATDGATMAGNDCIAAAQTAGVNLAPFTYVAVYVNDVLASGASGESWRAPLPAKSPTNLNALTVGVQGFTSPPLVLHELGHILGNLSSHTDSFSDPMGGGAHLGDDPSNLPTYLTSPRSVSVSPEWDASRREAMGFIPAASIATYPGTGTQTYSISRLTQPLPGLPTVVEVPLPNGAKYIISARTAISYDAYSWYVNGYAGFQSLPIEGVRIELYTSPDVDSHIEMSTPGGDPSSAAEVWLTGQTYTDTANGLTITIGNFNSTGNPTAQITVSSTANKAPVYQIDSGGPAAAPFVADVDYSAGNTYSTTATIDTSAVTNPAPQAVYQTSRYGNFTYTFPNLTPGASYKVRLHFAEIFWTAAGQRVFNVSINGNQVLTNFDIFATAGAQNKAVIMEYTATATANGQIVIQYTTVMDNAQSNGIEIIPQ
jgi:hypothetical protein